MKKLLSILLLVTMLVSVTACGANSAENAPATPEAPATESQSQSQTLAENAPSQDSDNLPVIGVTIYKYDDNYMSFVRSAIESAAAGKAMLQMADSMNDQAKQNDQVDTFISKGVQALAINLVEPTAAATIVEKARAADIPVIFFNKEPDASVINSYDKCWYAGITSRDFGVLQGELAGEKWKANPDWDKNGDGTIQYVTLKGEPGHPDAEVRTTASIETLESMGLPTQQLELQTGMWDASKAKELMETWLAKYANDEIEMVFANNDAMAMGAVEALKAAGYFDGNKYMPVFGVDGIPEATEMIRNGQMAGTVLNDPKALGQITLTMAANAAQGKGPIDETDFKFGDVKDVRVPAVKVNDDNLNLAEEAYR